MYTFLYTVTMIIDILHGHLINSRCRELQALVTARIVCEGCFYRCVSVDRGGGGLPQSMLGYHHPKRQTSPRSRPPRKQTPPRRRPPKKQTPQEAYPPRSRPSKKETPTPKSRSPLQAHMKGGNLGGSGPAPLPLPTEHAWRYGQRAGGTHPTGMQSCYSLHVH